MMIGFLKEKIPNLPFLKIIPKWKWDQIFPPDVSKE